MQIWILAHDFSGHYNRLALISVDIISGVYCTYTRHGLLFLPLSFNPQCLLLFHVPGQKPHKIILGQAVIPSLVVDLDPSIGSHQGQVQGHVPIPIIVIIIIISIAFGSGLLMMIIRWCQSLVIILDRCSGSGFPQVLRHWTEKRPPAGIFIIGVVMLVQGDYYKVSLSKLNLLQDFKVKPISMHISLKGILLAIRYT